jgi:hypothetical protein
MMLIRPVLQDTIWEEPCQSLVGYMVLLAMHPRSFEWETKFSGSNYEP